jgi:DNA-binding FrmR family transcriptional regulator
VAGSCTGIVISEGLISRRPRSEIAGQLRAVEQERSCTLLLQFIAAARGSLDGILPKVIEERVRSYLIEPTADRDGPTSAACG